MNNKKHLLENIFSLGIVQIANYVFPLITVPIISRIIGPEKYGVINYASTFVTYFILLINYGFDLTATRKIAKAPDNVQLRDIVFSEVLHCKIFLGGITLIVFVPCLYFFAAIAQDKQVAIFSFVVVLANILTATWLFQAMQKLKKIAILGFIGKALFTILVLLLVRHQADYLWLPILSSLSQIVVSLISFILAIRLYHISFFRVRIPRIIEILKEERIVFVSMVVISLYTTTNTIILGILREKIEVGYYTSAMNLMNAVSMVISMPLSLTLYPFVGKAFGESLENGIKTIQKVLPIVFYCTLIAGIGMFLFGPIILRLFYGNKFLPSIPAFKVMVFVPLIISLSNILGIQIMTNLKMDKAFLYITLGGAVLGIILNAIMTHFWGYIGTAWNWVVVELYITVSMFFYLRGRKIYPIVIRNFSPNNVVYQIKSLIRS